MNTRRLVWLFVVPIVCLLLAGVVIYLENQDRCVGLPKERLIAFARRALVNTKTIDAARGETFSNLEAAKVAQFIDWKNPKAGYTIYFSLPGVNGEFIGVTVSGACGTHLSYTKELVPPI